MFEEPCRQNLLAVARAYCAATELSMATVSRKFHGNQAFFADFKKGTRSVTLSKFQEMMTAFANGWPAETPRPSLVPIQMTLDPPTPSKGKK